MTTVGQAAPGGNEHTVVRAEPPDRTQLVVPRTSSGPLTARRDSDTRTALTRGLAEYISSVVVEREDGRKLRFQKVFSSWAEPEEGSVYPSAIAYTIGAGVYEASKFAVVPTKDSQLPAPDERYALSPSEFVIDVTVEIWATDPPERTTLVAALEDTFNPFTGQYGFSLDLPHYHNVRATFEPLQMGYMDSETDAMQRNRKAMFLLNARVPLIKLASFPDARTSVRVVAVGPNVVVDGSSPC